MSRSPDDRYARAKPSLSAWLPLLLLLGIGVFLLIRTWPGDRLRSGADPHAQPRPITPRGDLAGDEKSNIELFKAAAPSTVHVNVYGQVRRDPFSLNVLKVPRGAGSGFVWDEQGRIVTNYHVIRPAIQGGAVNMRNITVTLADHSSWGVYDASFDDEKDLAVLWTEAPKDRLKPVLIGESANLQVGQKVFAIGNPFGLDQSLTTGIISALGRDLRDEDTGIAMRGLIQTDAAINPGNSGGPLLDSSGRLIGVNNAIVSPSGASAGIGFAIPVDEVNRVVTRLIKKQPAVRPALGIYFAPDQVLKKIGKEGVLVLDVVPGGPAEKAGLRTTEQRSNGSIRWGDIITAIDGKKVKSTTDLLKLLEDEFQIGQQVTLSIIRDEQQESVPLTLGASTK